MTDEQDRSEWEQYQDTHSTVAFPNNQEFVFAFQRTLIPSLTETTAKSLYKLLPHFDIDGTIVTVVREERGDSSITYSGGMARLCVIPHTEDVTLNSNDPRFPKNDARKPHEVYGLCASLGIPTQFRKECESFLIDFYRHFGDRFKYGEPYPVSRIRDYSEFRDGLRLLAVIRDRETKTLISVMFDRKPKSQ